MFWSGNYTVSLHLMFLHAIRFMKLRIFIMLAAVVILMTMPCDPKSASDF